MEPVALRPLRVPEIVDSAILAWRDNAVALVTLTAVVLVPTAGVATVPLAFGDRPPSIAASVAIVVAGLTVALAGCVQLVGRGLLGEQVAWQVSLRLVGRRSGALVVLVGRALVSIAGGAILFVVGGIWVALGQLLALPAMLLEPASPGEALRRSRNLSGDRRVAAGIAVGMAVGIVAVAGGVVATIVRVAVFRPAVATDATRLAAALMTAGLSAILGVPLVGATLVLAYTDARVRREGLDLQFQLDAALRRSGVTP